ncbi:hypothetical protein FV222_02170 [Methylobacterium sp. WL103]|uniref:hypothetical protein n=1 Tax=Methylobacterium sp. WL103 TaxID=2603891 RepID=UPI0011CA8F31|nr:hypothetical protein [Methylobacterium sp. WL103]TXN07491.1 hypothetical protein FV222_02170 [Methylobacterium sp. WL103]
MAARKAAATKRLGRGNWFSLGSTSKTRMTDDASLTLHVRFRGRVQNPGLMPIERNGAPAPSPAHRARGASGENLDVEAETRVLA